MFFLTHTPLALSISTGASQAFYIYMHQVFGTLGCFDGCLQTMVLSIMSFVFSFATTQELDVWPSTIALPFYFDTKYFLFRFPLFTAGSYSAPPAGVERGR